MDAGGEKRAVDWKKRKQTCEETIDNSYLGYFTALTRSHIPFDVVLDKHISTEGLARYRVLILPNSACLSDAQIEAIGQFVERGGSVIAEFETGAYNESGRSRDANPLLDTLGVGKAGPMMRTTTLEEYVRVTADHPATSGFAPGRLLPRPPYSLECEAAVGEALSVFMNPVGGCYAPMKGQSGIPSMIANTVGAGRSIYIPSLIGDFYWRFRLPDYQALIESAVLWAHGGPLPISIDCPATVEMEPRWSSGKDQLLIHLANATGDMQRPITEIIPIRDVRVRLRRGDVKRVRALRADIDLPITQSGSEAEFVLPELDVYELVVVELG